MHPVLIDFGFFKLHTYGLMITIAFLIGMQLSSREARRVDLSPKKTFDKFMVDLTFWILLAAIVGARVVFIIVEWDQSYSQDPLKVFRIWEGGLVFFGGLIGAVLFSVWYSYRKGWSFFFVADICIPLVALGQFFGRLGCFAAGCCWGDAVDPDAWFGVQFGPESIIYSSMKNAELIGRDATHSLSVHPVQLYESFSTLMIFIFLLWFRRRKRFHGQLLVLYMAIYPIARFSLEFLRGDKIRGVYENVFGASTSQIISVALFVTAIILHLRLSKHPTPTPYWRGKKAPTPI